MPGQTFLEGDRISLRTVEKEDIEFLRDGVNHPEVRKHMGNTGPQNLESEEEFFENIVEASDGIHLLICREDEPMGIVKLEEKEKPSNIAELGLWLHPEFHSKGYGTEAIELIVEHGFRQLNYQKLYARAHEDNKGSQRIWEKHGFEKEGQLREHVLVEGEHRDMIYYGLLRGEHE